VATWNRFTVISGKLGVKTDKGHTTVIGPKQMFEVEPGVKHEFQTYEEPAIVEEVAYVKYDEHDIQRERLGGPLSNG
jgi:D-lyxose ketol-isomerase